MANVLGRYDAATLRRLCDEGGVLEVLRRRGFVDLEVAVESQGRALPHVLLYGRKGDQRYLLLDACVGEAVVRPGVFLHYDYPLERPLELAVVHWVREEDPTAVFPADRPPLPLQHHPGLGVLRQAFRVLVRLAADLNKDGIVSVPKFFHDAVIFFRSRLFLFLDGVEQGRFEAVMRDLRRLPLRDASLAFTSGAVRDQSGATVCWTPGYQVFPMSALLTAYFHSAQYAAQVSAGRAGSGFTIDFEALARVNRVKLEQRGLAPR